MLRLPLLLSLAGLGHLATAQCGACATGDTCTVDPPFPRVCPAEAPPGTVGVPYSADVTFWIPPAFNEPTAGLNVILEEVTLSSLENVPIGFTYEASEPSLVYYPQQESFGCVRICGVPLIAGNDTIIIHGNAVGTAGGLAITQGQDLRVPVLTYPAAQDTAPDFSASATVGCSPVSVDFDPLISAPGTTASYQWTFGNGNTFNGADPPTQVYSSSGDHYVSLQTTISVPMLTSLTVSDINEDWCGDVDEPDLPIVGCVGQPDLYFTVIDAQLGLSRSPVINNTQSHTWNNLHIPLGFPPFILKVYDSDGLSDDDLLGSFQFSTTSGNFTFSQGGTSGQGSVQVQTVQTFNYTDTITVLPAPNTTISMNSGTLCAADLNLEEYTWTFGGNPLPNETGPCVIASNGSWSVTGTNSTGCSSTSTYQVIGMGVGEHSNDVSIAIYPVPNSGRFSLKLEGWQTNEILTIEVLNAIGQVVHQERAAGNGREMRCNIDLGPVAAGPYQLRVSDGVNAAVRTFLVRPH